MGEQAIHGLTNVNSKVRIGEHYYTKKSVVELKFEELDDGNVHTTTVVVDRATASRLINQLRRALDDDYNRSINERPGGSDDYA